MALDDFYRGSEECTSLELAGVRCDLSMRGRSKPKMWRTSLTHGKVTHLCAKY